MQKGILDKIKCYNIFLGQGFLSFFLFKMKPVS